MQKIVVHRKNAMPTVEMLTDITMAVTDRAPAVYTWDERNTVYARRMDGEITRTSLMSTSAFAPYMWQWRCYQDGPLEGDVYRVTKFLDSLSRTSAEYIEVVAAGCHNIWDFARIVEIPDNVDFYIGGQNVVSEYRSSDGEFHPVPFSDSEFEYVEEFARRWGVNDIHQYTMNWIIEEGG